MLLDGQYHWEFCRHKGVVFDATNNVHETNPGGEGVAVVDNGLSVCPIQQSTAQVPSHTHM